MGKASKAKKARAALTFKKEPYASPAKIPISPPSPSASDKTDDPISPPTNLPTIDPIDLEITVETLKLLVANPSILKTPEHKPTRSLIHKLHGLLGGTFSKTPTTTTSNLPDPDSGDTIIHALRTRNHPLARALLANITNPKLGSLQRWVREVDAASVASAENKALTKEQHERNQNETWKTLECIIRTTTPGNKHPAANPLIRFPPWELTNPPRPPPIPVHDLAQSGQLCTQTEAAHYLSNFSLLHTTPGPDRLPPNLHPALLYTSTPLAIPLPPTTPTAHPVPSLPHTTLLHNVLPPSTCTSIIAAATTLRFTPDVPVSGSATQLSSILAHNFYWIADEAFNTALFERVRPFLPAELNGGKLKTINRRYRCYRYVPGAVYRPHVDGAWPPSGIIPATTSKPAEYIFDASAGTQYSRFTFLIYLNDEFDGGETTFFVPGDGGLEARAVRPRMGSVLVFPHGEGDEGMQALVHEGSAVRAGGKYIIRTDVVYEIPGKV